MAKYDDMQNLYKIAALAGNAVVASKGSPGIDCKGHEQAMIILKTGTLAATCVLTVTVQHSDDNGSTDAWANITGATFGALPDSADDTLYVGKLRLNVAGIKRYIRVHAVVATAVGEYAVCLLVGNAPAYPVSGNPSLTFNV